MTASTSRRRLRAPTSSDNMSSDPIRHYDRTWEEIEEMLELAIERKQKWKDWFEQCREDSDREGMMEAARNSKALDGVIKCLKWTLGEEGVPHPLD